MRTKDLSSRDSPSAIGGYAELSDSDFRLFQELILKVAGIYLAPVKKMLVSGRLMRRLRDLKIKSFRDYYELVADGGDPEERIRMLDRISTNETSFFREPHHFDLLREHIFPEWIEAAEAGRRDKKIKIWSAACSSGEEPYSIAMTVLAVFPPGSGWTVEILASDLSTRVLDRAEMGLWPLEKASSIPQEYLKKFMLKGRGARADDMKAGNELRGAIRFKRVNLHEDSYPVNGRYDLIFCRNVMIYFRQEEKLAILNKLIDHLQPTGYFFVGHAESLHGVTDRLRGVATTVYGSAGVEAPGWNQRPRRLTKKSSPRRTK